MEGRILTWRTPVVSGRTSCVTTFAAIDDDRDGFSCRRWRCGDNAGFGPIDANTAIRVQLRAAGAGERKRFAQCDQFGIHGCVRLHRVGQFLANVLAKGLAQALNGGRDRIRTRAELHSQLLIGVVIGRFHYERFEGAENIAFTITFALCG